jgi:hypothetical protein
MRLNRLLLLACLAVPCVSFGQQAKLEAGIKVGAASGLCDIGGISSGGNPWLLDIQPSQIRWDLGAYIRYKISRKWAISGHFDYMRLQGFDSLSKYTPIRDRNLNYRDDIIEGSLRAEWTFYDNPDVGGNFNYTTTFNAFLFAGVGIFHMNPEAMFTHTYIDAQSTWTPGEYYPLHTLTTEGEKQYSLIQPSIPVGIGFFYTFNKTVRLGWELAWNKTFTDYIDDVSGTYPKYGDNPNLINPYSKYLTNQSYYVPGIGASPQELAQYGPGSPRGNPKNNDSFISTAVTLGIMIHPKISKRIRKNFFDKDNYKSRASF